MMFLGPWTQGSDWDSAGIDGVSRFLHSTWRLALSRTPDGPVDTELEREIHRTIRKVTEDLGLYRFNTAIAALMKLEKRLGGSSGPTRAAGVRTLVLLLAPFAPFMTAELWARWYGASGSIHLQQWPEYDPALARMDEIVLVVQVDGKVRDRLTVASGLPDEEARTLAMASAKVRERIEGRTVARVVVVPDRLVSIVTGPAS
jgi:leucyl-tRNA synthetase